MRSFAPYLYYYGLQIQDNRAEYYTGFFGKSPLRSPGQLIDEEDLVMKQKAEDIAKSVLGIFYNAEKATVKRLRLILAKEDSNESQLWLLGAFKFELAHRERHVEPKRKLRINNPLIVLSKELQNTLTTKPHRIQGKLEDTLKRHNLINEEVKLLSKRIKLKPKVLRLRDMMNGSVLKSNKLSVEVDSRKRIASLNKSSDNSKDSLLKTINCSKHQIVKERLLKHTEVFPYNSIDANEILYPLEFLTLKNKFNPYEHEKKLGIELNTIKPNTLKRDGQNCKGDYCRVNSIASCPIDELLIHLGRLKRFSPLYNYKVRQAVYFISKSVERKSVIIRSKKLNLEETDKFINEKKIVENIFIDRVVKKLHKKVTEDPSWVNKLPEDVLNEIKRPTEIINVCNHCKVIYTRIARYIGKTFLHSP